MFELPEDIRNNPFWIAWSKGDTRLPNQIIVALFSKVIDYYEFILLIYFYSFSNFKSKHQTSRNQLHKRLGISFSKVSHSIELLIDKKYISELKVIRADDKNTYSIFTLLLVPVTEMRLLLPEEITDTLIEEMSHDTPELSFEVTDDMIEEGFKELERLRKNTDNKGGPLRISLGGLSEFEEGASQNFTNIELSNRNKYIETLSLSEEEESLINSYYPRRKQREREMPVFSELLKEGHSKEEIFKLIKELKTNGDLKGEPCGNPLSYLASGAYEKVKLRGEGGLESKQIRQKYIMLIFAHLNSDILQEYFDDLTLEEKAFFKGKNKGELIQAARTGEREITNSIKTYAMKHRYTII